MSSLHIEVVDEKRIRIAGIDPALTHCLFQLPEILRKRDTPGVRRRLFPDLLPEDPKANAEWHDLSDGDLHHLFVSAEETIVRDLTGLDNGEVTFPSVHLPAWISAINQARLILGELHDVTEADLSRTDFDVTLQKDIALFEIWLLEDILQLLVDHAPNA